MGRPCPAHDIPQFNCIDCRRIATLRQAAEDGPHRAGRSSIGGYTGTIHRASTECAQPSRGPVTDLSTIGGFGLDHDELSTMNTRLELSLSDTDYIYEIAQRLRDKPRR